MGDSEFDPDSNSPIRFINRSIIPNQQNYYQAQQPTENIIPYYPPVQELSRQPTFMGEVSVNASEFLRLADDKLLSERSSELDQSSTPRGFFTGPDGAPSEIEIPVGPNTRNFIHPPGKSFCDQSASTPMHFLETYGLQTSMRDLHLATNNENVNLNGNFG
jgi:hypothetical protein